ncbi:MAG: ThuA domain-containing protein [Anaerolineae bacterium]
MVGTHGARRSERRSGEESSGARARRYGLDRAALRAPLENLQGADGNQLQPEVARDPREERIWVVNPAHPIVEGLGDYFEIPHAEMYGEPFGIPEPDSLVFVSWFEGGEVFRSGCAYYRGQGKVFYFRPGHETYPIYYQKEIRQVLANAVRWVAPTPGPASGRQRQGNRWSRCGRRRK